MSGQILRAADIPARVERDCDVCVIGSGAGGAVLAAGLVEQGLDVVMLEEGNWNTRKDFDLDEGRAYTTLYQGRGAWTTADLSMTVLQGRGVGGGTTVNWTTCYRTPERILDHWREVHGVEGWDASALAPHFEAVEQRLSISEWPEALANANNRVLLSGCRKLGWEAHTLRRNVAGCGSTGYCGLGCPLDAKQAMGITYIADAVSAGLTLYSNTKCLRLQSEGRRITAVHAEVLDPDTDRPLGRELLLRPKVTVLSAGALGSPAVLIRSGLDRDGLVGRRTCLHPVIGLPAIYSERIDGFYGAPQAVASHEFVDRGPGRVGWFMETPPMQPMLISTATTRFGEQLRTMMTQLPYTGTVLGIAVDGLLKDEDCGTVTLRRDGRIRLDYSYHPALLEAFRSASVAIARVSLAAGADEVHSGHIEPVVVRSEADIPTLEAAAYGPHEHPIFTAHQMGGCAMGGDPRSSVVSSQLRHHDTDNLFVVDGSVLPTGLGVNPSETIYGIAHRSREWIAAAV